MMNGDPDSRNLNKNVSNKIRLSNFKKLKLKVWN